MIVLPTLDSKAPAASPAPAEAIAVTRLQTQILLHLAPAAKVAR